MNGLDFNFFNIFIISASIHGLIFSLIVLFSKKFNAKPNRFLAYYVLLVSLNNIYFWFIDAGFVDYYNWEHFWLFPIQWDLLMFPALFYFISSYLGNKKMHKFYMYPFYISFPFFIFFMFQQIFFSDIITVNSVNSFYSLMSYISMLFSAIAIVHAFKLIGIYKKEETKGNQLKIEVNWLKKLLLLLVLVFLLWILIYTFNSIVTQQINERTTTYVLWISMSLLIYWMGYLGIYHLGIFNQRQDLRAKLISEKIILKNKPSNGNTDRFNDIDSTIKKERLYTNPSIGLQIIAQRFNISEGYVSQLINKHNNTNFSTYINNLRILEAKRILTDVNYKDYTIVAIALESGFNSKSAFYAAFKKSTGMSPIEYQKQHNLS